jgi:PPK2 family polyphosphate:nucleotide phosphotransferase
MATSDRLGDLLRVPPGPGPVTLATFDPAATPGFDGGKSEGKQALTGLGPRLSRLQEMLFAEGRTGGSRSVLLVLQGMDTSGKGGVMRHAVALFDPQGVHIKAFGRPTEEELAHDFLWRVRRELPGSGIIGIFDRSHYEDVLVGRVRELAPPEEIERRYEAINAFEAELVASGTTLVKCLLHISADEQRHRLLRRLDRPKKQWKFDPGDIEDRALWSEYRCAYETVLRRTNTDAAPWFIVPSDRKWYRNWAVAQLLLETLDSLDLGWPEADFDVEKQRRRLTAEGFGD